MNRAELTGRVLSTTIVDRLLAATERTVRWPPNRLAVLTYHRVDRIVDDGRYPGLISATPEHFEDHLRLLGERFEVVDLPTVLAAVAGETRLPARSVLLTFDDGVDDFRTNAWPALERAGLPAVVFVPTAFAGSEGAFFWWDAVHAAVTTTERRDPVLSPIGPLPLSTAEERDQAFRRLRDHLKVVPYDELRQAVAELCADCGVVPPAADVMSWDALRTLTAAGVSCCAHTRTHPHLDAVPVEQARAEIEGSLEDLRRELGDAPLAFAYPSGRYDEAAVRLVRDAGFVAAFTTERGTNRLDRCDPFTLRRINVSRRTGMGAVRFQAHPWADALRRTTARAS